MGEARNRGLVRRAGARQVTRMQSRRAGDREIREAVARRVCAPRGTVALGAAEAAPDSALCETAEPLAGRLAPLGTAAALNAGLAREADVGAGLRGRPAWITGAATAADATRDCAHGNPSPCQEEPGPERGHAETLEELAPRRLAGEPPRCDRCQVHLLSEAWDRRPVRWTGARLVARVQSRRAGDCQVREAVAGSPL